MQRPDIDLEVVVSVFKSLLSYFQNLRNSDSFNNFDTKARELLANVVPEEQLTYNPHGQRKRKRNTRYDYGNAEDTVLDDRTKLRVEYYNILDYVLNEVQVKLNAYENDIMPFNFLLKLDTMTEENIRKDAKKFWEIYRTDVDEEICDECVQFKFFMGDVQKDNSEKNVEANFDNDWEDSDCEDGEIRKDKRQSKSSKMLQYIKKNHLEATFPNIEVALRIFECIAVCNASGERSFNALKRVKNFQRSTMGQDYLNDLAILFIESEMLKHVNVEDIINKFSEAKSRKKKL